MAGYSLTELYEIVPYEAAGFSGWAPLAAWSLSMFTPRLGTLMERVGMHLCSGDYLMRRSIDLILLVYYDIGGFMKRE